MSNPFAFLKRQDPVETIIILLGGLLVVVFAFFMARGDLDYYTEYLLTGNIFEEKVEVKEVSPSTYAWVEEEFEHQEESVEGLPSQEEIPSEEVAPSTQIAASAPPEEKKVEPPAKPAAPSSPPPKVAEAPSGGFFVQCGAFSQPANAQKMVDLLKGFGYQAVSEPVSGLHRVRIYGFQSSDEAQKVANKLKGQGIEAFVGK
ncbi:MAG TPA: SPOR domain-containing protein [Candidatus Atribacteria bacterium]|nr:SPOR domain-containing protein [Candidatus Atribacteria bacterium]HPZ81282.1 SPOR domain-containing protein [Candidatus Atribacteria bacterium]HQE24607.1 SPOR domain-containing protein [Candidatus Atribacteria bacterium]